MAANQNGGDGSRRGPFEHTREHSPDPAEFEPKVTEGDDIYRWERTREHEPKSPFSFLSFHINRGSKVYH